MILQSLELFEFDYRNGSLSMCNSLHLLRIGYFELVLYHLYSTSLWKVMYNCCYLGYLSFQGFSTALSVVRTPTGSNFEKHQIALSFYMFDILSNTLHETSISLSFIFRLYYRLLEMVLNDVQMLAK